MKIAGNEIETSRIKIMHSSRAWKEVWTISKRNTTSNRHQTGTRQKHFRMKKRLTLCVFREDNRPMGLVRCRRRRWNALRGPSWWRIFEVVKLSFETEMSIFQTNMQKCEGSLLEETKFEIMRKKWWDDFGKIDRNEEVGIAVFFVGCWYKIYRMLVQDLHEMNR